jgi:MarR family transcriptional regulator, lower aerobic nicotinate degradation pathway regulator
MEHFTINLANRLRQRASNVLARHLAPIGLTPQQFFVLYALDAEQMALSVLSDAVGSDRSTISEMVSRLTEAGLLDKQDGPLDRRVRVIRLTRAGRSLLNRAKPLAIEAEKQVVEMIPASQRKQFLTCLAMVVSDGSDDVRLALAD